MDPLLQGYTNYGALGLMIIVLIIAVKVLYVRNTKLNDKFPEVVIKNSEAMNTHATAIREFSDTVKDFRDVIHKCSK